MVTATTRPPRNGEREGVDFFFLNPEAFEAKVRAGEFYEYAKVHTHRYGTLKIEIEKGLSSGIDLLLNIDVQGAASLRRAARDDSNLADRLVTLFVRLKNLKQAEERLLERGKDSPDAIAFGSKPQKSNSRNGPTSTTPSSAGARKKTIRGSEVST